jgi:GNAT superfamily N-acetyltransferase
VSFDLPTIVEASSDLSIWQLYAAAFPAEEREPEKAILASMDRGAALLARARVDGKTAGFAVLHLLTKPAAAFLVYLAVSPQYRRRGIGSSLFGCAWERAQHLASIRGTQLQGMVWEVDDPEQAQTSKEKQRRLVRIGFFQHLGARLLETNYFQPPVNGPCAVPMLLMYRSATGEHPPAVSDLVRAMYFEKYGAANGIPAPTLRKLLATLESV